MSSAIPQPQNSLAEGYYTVTSLVNGIQLGYDWFAVRENGHDGLVVESKHTIFGSNIPVQHARFEIERDWTPRRFEISAGQNFKAAVDFGESETLMTSEDAQGAHEFRVPVGRRRAYLLVSGGLYFPLHIVRRFDFQSSLPKQFDLLPEGVCEVRRIEDAAAEDGQRLRQLEMKVMLVGVEDTLSLVVDEHDDLLRYQTRNLNLLVKYEKHIPSC